MNFTLRYTSLERTITVVGLYRNKNGSGTNKSVSIALGITATLLARTPLRSTVFSLLQ